MFHLLYSHQEETTLFLLREIKPSSFGKFQLDIVNEHLLVMRRGSEE
jgi:hypothetical protein